MLGASFCFGATEIIDELEIQTGIHFPDGSFQASSYTGDVSGVSSNIEELRESQGVIETNLIFVSNRADSAWSIADWSSNAAVYASNRANLAMEEIASLPDPTISVIGIKETEGVISTNRYDGIKELEFDGGAGFYVDETLPTRAFITLGSHWYTLFLDDGNTNGYTPSAQQDLQIRMDTNATFAGTFMDTNTTYVKEGETNNIWTLYIPTVAGPQGSVYSTTSTNSLTVGLGTKSVTVDTKNGAVDFMTGQPIILSYGDSTWMLGNTISYDKEVGSLSVSVVTNSGSGTYESWNVALTGTEGRQGLQGIQGIQGFPGYSMGVYAGAWNTNATYTNNAWFTYGGNVYGSVWTNWVPKNTWPFAASPTNYIAGGQVITLSVSGQSGTDGAPGAGLFPAGSWSAAETYPQYALVKLGYTSYYNKISSSFNQNPTSNPTVWEPFLVDGINGSNGVSGANAFITSNAVFFGRFDNTLSYVSNTFVYWDATNYGTYLVLQDCTPIQYNPTVAPPPGGITNTNYFRKVAHYGRDGATGATGAAGLNGVDGADGADGMGNMWFEKVYDPTKVYEGAGYVVVYNDETYISKTNTPNVGKVPGTTTGSNYWYTGAAKGEAGAPGATYKFYWGYSNSVTYNMNDVVISSNIFWLCKENGTIAQPPWDWPTRWIRTLDADYRYYATLPIRTFAFYDTYVSNELVRYTNTDGRWSTYVCISTNSVTQIYPNADTNKFVIVASAGEDGEQGPAGVNGITTNIHTYIYTNWSTNIFFTTNYTSNFWFTNYYTSTVSAISWTNKNSNNVYLDSSNRLNIMFNTNYTKITGFGVATSDYNYVEMLGDGTLKVTFKSDYVTEDVIDDKITIYSNNAKYASRTPLNASNVAGTVYINLSNAYYRVSNNGQSITGWNIEYPSTNMGAIWKIDLELVEAGGGSFSWAGTGITNSPPSAGFYSYIFEVIQGTTNIVAY